MSKLRKGIFWAVEIEPLKLITVNAPCDENGNFTELPNSRMLSTNGRSLNHKNAWVVFDKGITDNKPFDYYPRGRVEIRNGRATIFANPAIPRDELVEFLTHDFCLSESNGIKDVRYKADNSSHYRAGMYYED